MVSREPVELSASRIKQLAKALMKVKGWMPKYSGSEPTGHNRGFILLESALIGLQKARISPKIQPEESAALILWLRKEGLISINENSDEFNLSLVMTGDRWGTWEDELRGSKRRRRWTVAEAEEHVRRYLDRSNKAGIKKTVRQAAEDLDIPKTTIGNTRAWKSLGSDRRKHITVHTGLTESTAVSDPEDS